MKHTVQYILLNLLTFMVAANRQPTSMTRYHHHQIVNEVLEYYKDNYKAKVDIEIPYTNHVKITVHESEDQMPPLVALMHVNAISQKTQGGEWNVKLNSADQLYFEIDEKTIMYRDERFSHRTLTIFDHTHQMIQDCFYHPDFQHWQDEASETLDSGQVLKCIRAAATDFFATFGDLFDYCISNRPQSTIGVSISLRKDHTPTGLKSREIPFGAVATFAQSMHAAIRGTYTLEFEIETQGGCYNLEIESMLDGSIVLTESEHHEIIYEVLASVKTHYSNDLEVRINVPMHNAALTSHTTVHPFIALQALHAMSERAEKWVIEAHNMGNMQFQCIPVQKQQENELFARKYLKIYLFNGRLPVEEYYTDYLLGLLDERNINSVPQLQNLRSANGEQLKQHVDRAAANFFQVCGQLFNYHFLNHSAERVLILVWQIFMVDDDTLKRRPTTIPMGALATFAQIIHAAIGTNYLVHMRVEATTGAFALEVTTHNGSIDFREVKLLDPVAYFSHL